MVACGGIRGRPHRVQCAGIRATSQQQDGRAGVFDCRVERGPAAGVTGTHLRAALHQPGDVGGGSRRRSGMKRCGAVIVHGVDVRPGLQQGRGDPDLLVACAGGEMKRRLSAGVPGIGVRTRRE